MDFHFPQRIRLGQGVSQHVGLAAKEAGARALVITESAYEGTKELAILTQSLERAMVPFMVLQKSGVQDQESFIREAATVARASFADVIVALGAADLLSIGRAIAMEIPKGKPVPEGEKKPTAGMPYIEVPSVNCFPLLLREEGFLSSGHAAGLKFFNAPLYLKHRIFLDPHMATGLTPKSSVAALLETLFFAIEGYCHELAGLTEQSLLLGAIESVWSSLKNVYDNPANVEYRTVAYQAGFSVSVALALLPRAVGLTLTFVLGGIAGIPAASLGSLFLAPFLESFGSKAGGRIKPLARAFGLEDWNGPEESLGLKVAQEVRKFLNTYSLPLRLADYKLVEAQLNLSVDVVKSQALRRGGLLDVELLPEFLKQVL